MLPLDFEDIIFVRFELGKSFLEHSRKSSMKVWEHERMLEPHAEGTLLSDRIRFEPRRPVPGQQGMFTGLFRCHEHLRKNFGGWPT